jgi:hypothetical protein
MGGRIGPTGRVHAGDRIERLLVVPAATTGEIHSESDHCKHDQGMSYPSHHDNVSFLLDWNRPAPQRSDNILLMPRNDFRER